MSEPRRRFRRPDLLTSLSVTVVVAMAVSMLLPYI